MTDIEKTTQRERWTDRLVDRGVERKRKKESETERYIKKDR